MSPNRYLVLERVEANGPPTALDGAAPRIAAYIKAASQYRMSGWPGTDPDHRRAQLLIEDDPRRVRGTEVLAAGKEVRYRDPFRGTTRPSDVAMVTASGGVWLDILEIVHTKAGPLAIWHIRNANAFRLHATAKAYETAFGAVPTTSIGWVFSGEPPATIAGLPERFLLSYDTVPQLRIIDLGDAGTIDPDLRALH